LQNNRILSLLGLCMKAGKIKSGEFGTTEAVKSGAAKVVIVADDASDNTKKEFRDMCSFYKVPYFECSTKEDLGRAIGKDLRSSLSVCDEGFSKSLIMYLESQAEGKVSE